MPSDESPATYRSPKTCARRKGFVVFQLLACNVACLVIAALYYTWRDAYTHRRNRVKLRERVAYMLWVAANRAA